MKIEDFFIGAWVYLKIDNGGELSKEPHKVTGIMTDTDTPCVQNDAGDVFYTFDSYLPITLTPEIMRKIGFEKIKCEDDEYLWSLDFNYYTITFESLGGCPRLTIEDVRCGVENHDVLVINDGIYNFHDLQRAFSIFGIPLEFNNNEF